MQFSKLLIAPCLIAIGILAYIIFKNDWVWLSWYVAIPAIMIALLFVFSPQIDWWFWQFFPPKPDKKIQALYRKYVPLYNELDPEELKFIDTRVILFLNSKIFQWAGGGDTPQDLNAIIAWHAVYMTRKHKDFLLEPYDRYVFYKKLFPSPEHPYPHASEVNHEDGVFVFSVDMLSAAFKEPTLYFNPAWYEISSAWMQKNKKWNWPKASEDIRPQLEHISGFTEADIMKMYGYKQLDLMPLVMHHYFAFNTAFRVHLPELAGELDNVVLNEVSNSRF